MKNLYVTEAYALKKGDRFDLEVNSWGDQKARKHEYGEFKVIDHSKVFDYKTGLWFKSVLVVK